MTGRPSWLGGNGSGRPVVLAHRGGWPPDGRAAREGLDRPWENTVDAFAAARVAGADGVELDVRAAADDTLVVLHDPVVPDGRPVHALERTNLPTWLPTLTDALAACAGLVLDVEVKAPPAGVVPGAAGVAARVVDALAALGAGTRAGPRHVLLTSFWPDALAAALERAATSGAALSVGLLVHPALDAAGLVGPAAEAGCGALLPSAEQVTVDLVAAAHRADLAVVAWTVNGAPGLDAVLAAGVDGVITDDVGGTVAHLSSARL